MAQLSPAPSTAEGDRIITDISQPCFCSLVLYSFVLHLICESTLIVWAMRFTNPLEISTTWLEKGQKEHNPKRQVLVPANTAALTQGVGAPSPLAVAVPGLLPV